MGLEEMVLSRAKRDVIRNALVSELAKYRLPRKLALMLAQDREATDAFHKAWMDYQVMKARSEKCLKSAKGPEVWPARS